MKKSFLAAFILLFTAAVHSVQAQDTLKEGKITMAISFPDAGDKEAAMKSTMGNEIVEYYKSKSLRTEMKMSMGSMITIVNGKSGESYSLMNMMGMKYAMKFSSQQSDSLKKVYNSKPPKIKFTKDTKKILGYNCKRAIITTEMKGKKQTTDYWYTTDIIAPFSSSSSSSYGKQANVPGFPVETTMKMQNMTMVMTLSAIDKIPVADSMFEVPADYPIKTMDEIKQKMMSSMSMHTPGSGQDTAMALSRPIEGTFPEIEMNDANGKPLKLSSLRGKYVLVDFWASWCEPCRMQSPNLVKAYRDYKDKGFTIYSISLDSDKNKWQKAIAKDKLSWENHVCDFKGWTSPICLQLGIKGIPTNYLLDKDGKVIAAGLYDDKIEKTLNEKIK